MSISIYTATRVPSTLEAMLLLGRAIAIETIRRKEFYVILILSLFYMMGIVTAAFVGIESQGTMMFLLNLGISFAYIAAHVLTLLTAARQIPFEVENRTIYPLLAKPLSRRDYILGKWAATTATGVASFAILFTLSWLPWFLFPNRPELHGGLLVQSLVANVLSLSLMAALALMLSLVVPQGVNITLLGLFFFFGSTLLRFIEARTLHTTWHGLAEWMTAYLPNFGHLGLFTRYTDGIVAVSGLEFVSIVVYGGLYSAVAIALCSALFERRTL